MSRHVIYDGVPGMWASAALDICVRPPNLPKLDLPELSDGLHMPDVQLDALCDEIFATIARGGAGFGKAGPRRSSNEVLASVAQELDPPQ